MTLPVVVGLFALTSVSSVVITDALSGTGVSGLSTNDRGQIDYETMLQVDPDSILLCGHGGKTEQEFQDSVVSSMQDHDVASELTAVQEGRVFRGGQRRGLNRRSTAARPASASAGGRSDIGTVAIPQCGRVSIVRSGLRRYAAASRRWPNVLHGSAHHSENAVASTCRIAKPLFGKAAIVV